MSEQQRPRPRLVAENPVVKFQPEPELLIQLKRRCSKCGCTDDHACPGGCWWIGAELCSQCGPSGSSRRAA